MGAQPLPGQKDFRLPFSFTAGVKDGGTTLQVSAPPDGDARGVAQFDTTRQVQALSFSDNAEVSGAVVFAGYGLVIPESQNFGYDSYATLDVKDKVVVVLRYFPEDADQKTRTILVALRRPALQGDAGAPAWRQGVAGRHRAAFAERRRDDSDELRHRAGRVRDRRRQRVELTPPRRCSPGSRTARSTTYRRHSIPATRTPPGSPCPTSRSRSKPRWCARSRRASTSPDTSRRRPASLCPSRGSRSARITTTSAAAAMAIRSPPRRTPGKIHHGADDNASGTAAVLAAGRELAKAQRSRHVLLAFWSAEEIGLIGSNAFVTTPPVPNDQLAAYFNFDMVGRMQDNKLTVQAVGTSPSWRSIIERANVAAGFDLVAAGRSLSAHRRGQLQRRRRAEPGLLHRHARRLPQAE